MAIATVRPGRKAFTLMELLVVMTIILLLAGLTYMFTPSQGQRKMVSAADRVTTWLLTARQMAKRDGRPTGLRLIADPTNPGNIIGMSYRQQPDDFGPVGSAAVCANGTVTAQFSQAGQSFIGSAAAAGQADLAPVETGDYIEFNRSGGVYCVGNVTGPTTLTLVGTAGTIFPTLTTPVPFRIIRQPRNLLGEEDLSLPDGTAIYLAGCLNTPAVMVGMQTLPPQVLFSPAGAVMGQMSGPEMVGFWIYDTNLDPNKDPGGPATVTPVSAQPPILVTIQARTGLVGTYPVNPTGNPYGLAQTGRSSGL
jgi:prepilin-type N-terminal cleavage/methylation domain-containing protein